MTIQEASDWASEYLGKDVTPSNISYLLQYARVRRNINNGNTVVDRHDLEKYYSAHLGTKKARWKAQLGADLNWDLSFSEYKESETTKHVHRLHSYKGKFIPQLVEYFLDQHTDHFKRKSFFNPNDIILDPFCGSGTTLVQANELNLHSIGVDVSAFNAFMANVKIGEYDIHDITHTAEGITQKLQSFQQKRDNVIFENELMEELKSFNNKFFPSPEFRYKLQKKEINEKLYGREKAKVFLDVYYKLVKNHNIKLKQEDKSSFLDKWFLQVIREEIEFVFEEIKSIANSRTRQVLTLVLSRTIRSCRATTHADLGTLKEPVTHPYYCKKHGKICKPIFSILNWWRRYAQDTIERIVQFSKLRTKTFQACLVGDSRTLNIIKKLKSEHPELGKLAEEKRIAGIFSSPPYVGLINYHEQHAYAYDLFGFERKDELEIGPLYKGQGFEARKSYVKGISDVLNHCKQFFKPDYNIFLVANDKYGLYPEIARLSDLNIVHEYKRPVLNRVEKDRSAYSEIIFQMKEKFELTKIPHLFS